MQTHMCRPTIRRSFIGLSTLLAVAAGSMFLATEAQAQTRLDLPNPLVKPWHIGHHNGDSIFEINPNISLIWGNNNSVGQSQGGNAWSQGGGNSTFLPYPSMPAGPFQNQPGPFQPGPAPMPFLPPPGQMPGLVQPGPYFNQGPMIGSPGGAAAFSFGGDATAIGGNNQFFVPY